MLKRILALALTLAMATGLAVVLVGCGSGLSEAERNRLADQFLEDTRETYESLREGHQQARLAGRTGPADAYLEAAEAIGENREQIANAIRETAVDPTVESIERLISAALHFHEATLNRLEVRLELYRVRGH